jgi:hypothetical protein
VSKYFTHYPIIQYQRKPIRDLSRRSKVRDKLLSDPYIFLPYTVREGEKPETVAELYYGSVNDTWLVLFANNITDPYYQWPLDEGQFNAFFIEKYKDFSNRESYNVITWGQDQTRSDNIIYYYKKDDNSDTVIRISSDSFNENTSTEGWAPVRVYDYEKQQNENKREIVLIDKIYRNQVVEEFKRSLRA